MDVDTKDTIKEPLEFAPLDGIIQLIIEERIKEEKLSEQLKLEPRTINKKSDDMDSLLSDEMKLFLSNQTERHQAIINYITKALKLARKCKKYTQDNLKPFDKLLECEIGQFEIEIDDENKANNKPIPIIIIPPVKYYIDKKYKILCQLHIKIARSYSPLPLEKVNFKNINVLNKENRSALESLGRHFEAGADKYPYLKHCALSWPFLRKMPKPPKESINEGIKRFLEKYDSYTYNIELAFGNHIFMTEQTLTKDWFNGHEDSLKGLQRFSNLATEAGQLLWTIMMKEHTKATNDLLKREFANIWLFSIHYLRETHVVDDGWDGLFDDDSDFCDELWRKKLYVFRYTDDVFYESMRLCRKLLDSGEEVSVEKEKNTMEYLDILHLASEQASVEEIRLIYEVVEYLWRWISRDAPKNKSDFIKAWANIYATTDDSMTKIIIWLKWNKSELAKDIEREYSEFMKFVEQETSDSPVCKDLATSVTAARGAAINLAGKLKHIAELAKTIKIAGQENESTGTQLELNDTEQNIIEALSKNTLTGEKLAKKAGYPYNSNFKSTLSSLRKRGILGNKSPGYFVEQKYHFLLTKSD